MSSSYLFGYNTNDGDGCSLTCDIESGWTWSGGSRTSKDTCLEIWGDGIRFNTNSTYWDGGNKISGDGCSSTCTIETGYSWSGGTISSVDTCSLIWGDGRRIAPETWDDQNAINGDGWSSTWTVETGFSWSGGSSTNKDTWTAICGDSKKIIGHEAWEDGNVVNGDGCSSTCTIETGYSWSGGTISSVDICTLKCGDGKKFPSEFCDDGNLDNNDGWSSTCKVETGFTCIDGDTNNRDICSEVCGDGIVYVDTATNWDDGNLLDGDGCSHDWLVEYGYTWNGGTPSSPDVCKAKCGDGILLSDVEQCDDGDIKIGDGCDTYQCVGGISTSADAWSLLYIVPNITSVTSGNTAEVSFSHAMKQASISLNDL